MLKLTPTLLGHPTAKLGRFLQIPSTRGLGKCTNMISDINKVGNKVWNNLEYIWTGLGSLEKIWDNLAILSW